MRAMKRPIVNQPPETASAKVRGHLIEPVAIVFDMDGVIINSEVQWRAVEAEFLTGLIPRWSKADQNAILGMSAFDVWRKLANEYGLQLTEQEFVGFYRGLAGEIYGRRSDPIPGAVELVRRTYQAGIPLAVASSSPRDWIDLVINRFALNSELSIAVSSEDVGGRGKPAPDIYRCALERLGVTGLNALAIEDTAKGISSAKAAGMMSVGLLNETNSREALEGADLILETLDGVDPLNLIESVSPRSVNPRADD